MKQTNLFLILLFVMAWSFAWGQTGTTTTADHLKARQSLWMGSFKVTSFSSDTTFASATDLVLPTALATKIYAKKIGGRPVATTAPASGQVLGWDGTKWLPVDQTGAGVSQPAGQIVVGSGAGITSDTNYTWANQRMTLDMADPDLLGAPAYGIDILAKESTSGDPNNFMRLIRGGNSLVFSHNSTGFDITATGADLYIDGETGISISAGANGLSLNADVFANGGLFEFATTDSVMFDNQPTLAPARATERTFAAFAANGRLVSIEGIDSAQVLASAIRSVHINDGAVTGAKIAQGGATPGQVLAWNGTTWAPDTVTGGSGSKTYEEFAGVTGTTISPADAIPASNREYRVNLYRSGIRMQYIKDYTVSGSDLVLVLAATGEDFVLIIEN